MFLSCHAEIILLRPIWPGTAVSISWNWPDLTLELTRIEIPRNDPKIGPDYHKITLRNDPMVDKNCTHGCPKLILIWPKLDSTRIEENKNSQKWPPVVTSSSAELAKINAILPQSWPELNSPLSAQFWWNPGTILANLGSNSGQTLRATHRQFWGQL